MAKITTRRIAAYRRFRVLDEGAARSSVNKEVQLLLRVLRRHGYDLTIESLEDTPLPRRRLTPEEWQRLLDTANGSVRWLRALAAAVLAAATGLRRKPLARLTWANVDPFREVITWEGREYPYTAEVREVLIRLERRRMYAPGRCRSTDRIFAWRSWKDAWKAMTEAAGLPGVTLSDVREYNR